MKVIYSTLFLISSFYNSSVMAVEGLEGVKIHIVYAESWDPISYGKRAPAKGLLPEKMDHILSKQLGMVVTHTPVPWGRAQKMVETGAADAFVTAATPKRLEYAIASRSNVFVVPFVAIVKKQSHAFYNLTDPDDLSLFEGRTFCDVLGNGWSDYFYKDKPVNLHIVPSIKQCLKLLNVGRVDAIIHAAPVLNKYMNELSLSQSLHIKNKASQKSPHFPILISKKSHLGQDFLDQFDQYLENNASKSAN